MQLRLQGEDVFAACSVGRHIPRPAVRYPAQPVFPGPCHRMKRGVHNLRRRHSVRDIKDDADARAREDGIVPHWAGRSDRPPDTLHQRSDLLRSARKRDQRGELVAARPVELRRGLQKRADSLGGHHEHPVAVQISNLRVHQFEVVHVHHRDGKRIPRVQRTVERPDEGVPVRKPRHGVEIGFLGQPFLELLPLGEVAREEQQKRPVAVLDTPPVHLHGNERAVQTEKRRLEDGTFSRADLRGLVELPVEIELLSSEECGDVPAPQIRAVVLLQRRARRFVGHDDDTLRVDQEERVGDIHQQVFQGVQQGIVRAGKSGDLVLPLQGNAGFDHPFGGDFVGQCLKPLQPRKDKGLKQQRHHNEYAHTGEQNPQVGSHHRVSSLFVNGPRGIDTDYGAPSRLPDRRPAAFVRRDPDIFRRSLGRCVL